MHTKKVSRNFFKIIINEILLLKKLQSLQILVFRNSGTILELKLITIVKKKKLITRAN